MEIIKEDAIALLRAGDLDTLAIRHLWLVGKLASMAVTKWGTNYDDCFTEGQIGLVLGVKALKPDSKNPTSYLWCRIRGTIHDFCEKEAKERSDRRELRRAADNRGRHNGRRCAARVPRSLDISDLCDDTQARMVNLLIDGYTMKEIAAQIGVPLSSLYAARKSLQHKYDQIYHKRGNL